MRGVLLATTLVETWRWVRQPLVGALCLALTMSLLPLKTATGQIPGLPALLGSKDDPAALPPRVTRQGQIEIADVFLDGREIIRIASPAVLDRAQPGTLVPVEVRARDVEAKLQRVLARDTEGAHAKQPTYVTRFDPNSIRVRITTRGGQPVLSAADARGARPEELLTVTSTDAEYAAVTAVVLAERWQQILERELRDALQKRQPESIQSSLLRLVGIILAAVLLTWLLAKLLFVLGRRKRRLWEQYQQTQSEATSHAAAARTAASGTADQAAARGARPTTSEERHLLGRLLRLGGRYQRQYQLVRFARTLIAWIIIFIGVGTVAAVFYLIPQTRGLADRIVYIPVMILGAGFAAAVANGLLGLLIDLVADMWSGKDDPRRSLRIPTVVAALKGLAAAVLYLAAFVTVLEFVLIVPFTVVAIGAVLGLAVSFAAQSLVKDLVNGILILIEDQYALGDYIIIGEGQGVVERLNLRITQLRSPDGRLITIPNHAIVQVENKTRLWSRVDLCVTVDYATDVDRALAVVEKVAQDIEQDLQWRQFILAPHQMLGVEEISHAGVVLRFQLQTLPFKKEDLARELRRRLKIAFDREEIRIGVPQHAVTVTGGREAGGFPSWRERVEWRPQADHRQS